MRLRLSTTAVGYVIALPVLAVLSAAYALWHAVEDAIGYRQVAGRIMAVDDLCAPGSDHPQYSATRMTWHHCTTDEIGYAAFDESGRQIVRKVMVDVRYTSPADNRVHDKVFTMGESEASLNHFVGKTDMVGAAGPVMASLSRAGDIHYDKWRFSQSNKSR